MSVRMRVRHIGRCPFINSQALNKIQQKLQVNHKEKCSFRFSRSSVPGLDEYSDKHSAASVRMDGGLKMLPSYFHNDGN